MTITQILTNFWQLFCSIIAVLVAWWRITMKLSNWKVLHDKEIDDLKTSLAETRSKVDAVYPILVTLQTDMASVKTSLDFIKTSITQIVQKQ